MTRPNRQLRYQHGKTDSLDAEGAARSVLAGQAVAEPKTQTGEVEMIRHLKIARDTAVKSRSQALVTLKTLIINAPASLRDALDQISGKMALIRHIAAFRPGAITSTTASAKTAMRALAQRWLTLLEEIQGHDKALEHLVAARAPARIASHGIATMTAAEMLVLVGDDPTRIRSEAALAKLCGVCPIPASSGKTNRFRLNRGGNRQVSTGSPSFACATTSQRSPMSASERRTARATAKSSAVSSDISSGISSHTCALRKRRRRPLDKYRSLNAPRESFFHTLESLPRRRPGSSPSTNGDGQPRRKHDETCSPLSNATITDDLSTPLSDTEPWNKPNDKWPKPVSTRTGDHHDNQYLMFESMIVRAHQQTASGKEPVLSLPKQGPAIRPWGAPEAD